MRRFNLSGMLLLSLLLFMQSSCSKDDELTFKFDENGECYYPSVRSITIGSFEKNVVGYGWKYVSTREIDANGECMKGGYYDDLIGAGPHHYFFESGDVLKMYYTSSVHNRSGFATYTYSYKPENNRVVVGLDGKMQILSVEGDLLKVVEYMAVLSGGKKVYGYSTYKRMTDSELEEFQEYYSVDFDNLRHLEISVAEERVFISGREFEFDILDSNGPCTVEATFRKETCDITTEGNHVKVKLLKNGAMISVSDGVKHKRFWIFSTDEEMEPKGTDIYDFTYTELTLNKDKQLVTPGGRVLFEHSTMNVTPREGYRGSVLTSYNPSGLVVVDADKQARFFELNSGAIYLKELLPQTVLDELAAAGEGHSIEYKLELVNHAGVVFQVLPFKVTYK